MMIKKVGKKNMNMSTGKKSCKIVAILVKYINFISLKDSLWTVQQDTQRNSYRRSKETIIWWLLVQPWLQASNNTEILYPWTQLWLKESEQMTPWIH